MPANSKDSKDPYESYTIADWKWGFLRRNSRYRRAYRAIEWLKRRSRQPFIGFGGVVQHFDLLIRLTQRLGLNPDLISEQSFSGNKQSLPSPDIPAHEFKRDLPSEEMTDQEVDTSVPSPEPGHEFKRCPIKGSHVLLDHSDFVRRDPDAPLPVIDYLADHEVLVLVDTRFGLEEIVADLKDQLASYLGKQRNHVRKYKDYLTVWDLRDQGLTADKIASELWPEEYKKLAETDFLAEEKNPLYQRVHDHQKAAQKLIEDSFPPRKRYRRIKK